MNRFYLGLKRGTLQKSVYPLEGSMTIGRSGENDITLLDFDVSRSHARISFQAGAWIIEDLGSSNGIMLGEKRIDKRALKSGDAFQLGGITLTFMEERISEETEQLSETMQVFAALIKYQSPLIDPKHSGENSPCGTSWRCSSAWHRILRNCRRKCEEAPALPIWTDSHN